VARSRAALREVFVATRGDVVGDVGKRSMADVREQRLSALVYGVGSAFVAVFCYETAARLPGLREPYWVPLTALVVLYPDRKGTLKAGLHYFIGTAIGSVVGWGCAALWHENLAVYGAGVALAIGAAHVVRCYAAARLSAVAVTLITIVPHPEPPHVIAVLRFVEVSYGVACALAYTLAADLVAKRLFVARGSHGRNAG
jgi:uncharacterized membrane protein YccC